MKKIILILSFIFSSILLFTFINCNKINSHPLVHKISEIKLPNGFTRIQTKENEFGTYLRNLKLNTYDNQVYLYNGKLKYNQDAQYQVLTIDVGNKDLQQCADAVMRLWGDYLFSQERYGEINFRLANSEFVRFNDWANGKKAKIVLNKLVYKSKNAKDYSYSNYRKFMDFVFNYANTASLIKQLKQVKDISEIQIGDVFIQSGKPFGHAIIVVDIAENKSKKIFLLAQSYMPAQNIHILNNPSESSSPWYSQAKFVQTPEWSFTEKDLYRFQKN